LPKKRIMGWRPCWSTLVAFIVDVGVQAEDGGSAIAVTIHKRSIAPSIWTSEGERETFTVRRRTGERLWELDGWMEGPVMGESINVLVAHGKVR
jgi:hypothetical protein